MYHLANMLSVFIVNSVKIDIADNEAIIKKNLGQICLRRTLASLIVISLFMAGAIKIDWNKTIPTISAEIIKGRFLIIFDFFAKIIKPISFIGMSLL